MLRNPNIEAGQQLKPSTVYYAAIGVFASLPDYELMTTIHGDDHGGCTERARVYRKKVGEQDEYHVLYFPGKDNTAPLSPRDTTLSLKETRHYVDASILAELQLQSDQLTKHFFICQASGFRIPLGFSAHHFVYGNVTAQGAVIEDSMSMLRPLLYNENGAIAAITDQGTATFVRRNWQGINDQWQCGYYMLGALQRHLDSNIPTPQIWDIKQHDVDAFATHYNDGRNVAEQVQPAKVIQLPAAPASPLPTLRTPQAQPATSVFARTWVSVLSITLIMLGAGVLSAAIAALTGGFGAVLTPLIFSLALGGCIAGGLLFVSGTTGILGFLKKHCEKKSSPALEPIKSTHANVGEVLSANPSPVSTPRGTPDISEEKNDVSVEPPTPPVVIDDNTIEDLLGFKP